jgi:hypothetical protein
MSKRFFVTAFAALAAAAVLALPAFALTAQNNLTVKDSSCRLALSSMKLPTTAVMFHLINNGTVAHGLLVWGVKSSMIRPNEQGNLLVDFHHVGTYHYACTTGSYLHPKVYGKGVFKIVN